MKKNIHLNSRLAISAVVFFLSQFSLAGTYLGGAQQNVTNTASLEYETCGTVAKQVYNPLTQKNEVQQVSDNACIARNNQISATRGLVNQGAQTATAVLNTTTNELVKPTAPVLADCGSQTTTNGFFNSAYSSCQQTNSAKINDYNYKTDIYNRALTETNKSVTVKSEQDLYSNMDDSTATGGLDEIQKKNEDGDSLYTAAAQRLAGLAAQEFMKSNIDKGKCSSGCGGCCAKAAAEMAQGIAYMILNGKSNKQADEHQASAYQACTAYNQLSSTQKTCVPPASTTTKYTRPEGCTSINVADCPGVGSDIAGLNGKQDNSGASSFISPELNKFAEVLPDGSVKTPDGKIYSLSDFKDVKSLMAKGLTAAQAQSVLDQLNSKDGALAKAGLDTKGQLKGLNFSPYSSDSGSTKVIDINAGADSGKLYKDKLNGLSDDEKNRKPSSEGLAKEFNGELIGVANDDIFLMMNRRYKRIGDQDTLISP